MFYLAGFIKSLGRRIEKICTVCKNDVVFQLEFTVYPQHFMIKFSAQGDRIVRTSTERVTEKVTERVTETENRLRTLLRENPVCRKTGNKIRYKTAKNVSIINTKKDESCVSKCKLSS